VKDNQKFAKQGPQVTYPLHSAARTLTRNPVKRKHSGLNALPNQAKMTPRKAAGKNSIGEHTQNCTEKLRPRAEEKTSPPGKLAAMKKKRPKRGGFALERTAEQN